MKKILMISGFLGFCCTIITTPPPLSCHRRLTNSSVINYKLYVQPLPLPLSNPPFEETSLIKELLEKIAQQLAALNAAASKLSDHQFLVRSYAIKEALIREGTSYTDSMKMHTPLFVETFLPDRYHAEKVQFALNYEEALSIGQQLMQDLRLPLSAVLTRVHGLLLGNGAEKARAQPGLIRKEPIVVKHYIMPAGAHIDDWLVSFDTYAAFDDGLSPLIRTGILLAQLFNIHPFADGNGRTGRLMVTLLLIRSGLLQVPFLLPGIFFRSNSRKYTLLLDKMQLEGDFEVWIEFFLEGILAVSRDAYLRVHDINKLYLALQSQLKTDPDFRDLHDYAQQLLEHMFKVPVVIPQEGANKIMIASDVLEKLMNLFSEKAILAEQGQYAHKLYVFKPLIDILEKEYV